MDAKVIVGLVLAAGAVMLAANDRDATRRLAPAFAEVEMDAPPGPEVPPSGRVTVSVQYGDGAFYLYDRSRWPSLDGSLRAIEELDDLSSMSADDRGILAVSGPSGDSPGVPLEIALRASPPGPVEPRFEGAAEHDLPLETGELVTEANGGGLKWVAARVPPGRYRARLSARIEPERFRLDLWPSREPAATRVLLRPAALRSR